jgi:adenylosuccinate synthase
MSIDQAPSIDRARAILVVDLGFGDAGKGSIVDYLARARGADLVVRFNGGPQAGHNVVTPDGRHHTFSQFGSGSFVPGVRTLLSHHVFIEPYALFNEARHLSEVGVDDAMKRLLIDARCPVITPFHQAANRLRELAREDHGHGTCGIGFGETVDDLLNSPNCVIRAEELDDRRVLKHKLLAVQAQKMDQLCEAISALRDDPRAQHSLQTLLKPTWLDAALDNYQELPRCVRIIDAAEASRVLAESRTLIFEGAQGVLLDEKFGFHPHTTWSCCTFANAESLLDEAGFSDARFRLGVSRCYMTRHGAGPLVTEDDTLKARLGESHNSDSGAQGRFRVGSLDAVALRYAIRVTGRVDGLALTHLDRLPQLPPRICTSYSGPLGNEIPLDLGDYRTAHLKQTRPMYSAYESSEPQFLRRLESELVVPVMLTSNGPTFRQKCRVLKPPSLRDHPFSSPYTAADYRKRT